MIDDVTGVADKYDIHHESALLWVGLHTETILTEDLQ
jgi:hypothetical protein